MEAEKPQPPQSLMDAFSRLEKVFDAETTMTRAAIQTVRDLVIEHYQRTTERVDAHARKLRKHDKELRELQQRLGIAIEEADDGL